MRHPGVVPVDTDELRRFFEFRDFAHFVDVYLAVVDLIRTDDDIRYLTYEVARELADEPAGPVRRADLHAVHLGAARTTPTAAYRSRSTPRRSRTPGSRPSATSGSCCAGSTTSPARAGCRQPTRPCRSRLNHRIDALVGFGLGGPEIGVARGTVPAALRRSPAGRAAQRAARRRDDRPGDGLGLAAPAGRRADRPRHLGGAATRSCSTTSPRAGCRWRSAPRPTSRRRRWRAWTSTRSGPSATPA